MTQSTTRSRSGWQQDEIDILFSAVAEAAEAGRPLRDAFSDVAARLRRKPNSIRNYYYARVRDQPQLCPRQTPFRAFTGEEVDWLLRQVLMARGQGQSVRACVSRLADGDRAGMLRYQNKYRSVLKNRPEKLLAIAGELRAQGLPCPADVTACRHYTRPAAVPSPTLPEPLANHLADPAVRAMVDGLTELLARLPSQQTDDPAPMVSYAKYAEALRQADRLKVEVDLLKLALEGQPQNEPV